MKDKTVLEKIGITNEIVKNWEKENLKIAYPMKKRKEFFKSDDGIVFIEGADKFVPPLTKKETLIYTKDPRRFKKDFFKNANLFKKFLNFLFRYQKRVKKLKSKDKIPVLLSLIYLFHSAMDFHYFHWDRYLVYENYPSTPVGFWLAKLKDFYFKVKKEKVYKLHPPEDFLKLLSLDKEIFNEFKENLNKKEFRKFQIILKAIKIFEEVQQKEIDFFLDYKEKKHLFFKTILPMWSQFEKAVKEYPETIKKNKIVKLKKTLTLHPLIGTREIFYPTASTYFNKEIFFQFQKEIKRWL